MMQFLKQYRALAVLAPVKMNQPPVRSQAAQQQLKRLWLLCETVNAQEHLSRPYAKVLKG